MDRSFVTYELTYPHGLDLTTAVRLFTALEGLFEPMGRLGKSSSRPIVVFEVLATEYRLHHLLSFPPDLETSVRLFLHGVLPAIRVKEFVGRPRIWTRAVELHRPRQYSDELDEKFLQVLLNAMRGLGPNEAILSQIAICASGLIAATESSLMYKTVARLAVSADGDRAGDLLQRVKAAYRPLSVVHARALPQRWLSRINDRTAPLVQWPESLTNESLVVLAAVPVGSPQVQGLELGRGRCLAPEPTIPTDQRRIGYSNALGASRPLTLSPADRLAHTHVVGPTMSGKTSLLAGLIADDMAEGAGLVVMDPLGPLTKRVLDLVPPHRVDDVILLDFDTASPTGLNVLAGSDPYVVTSQLVTVFERLFDFSSAPRAIDVLRSTVLTLALHGLTLCEIPLILEPGRRGQRFRDRLLPHITNNELRDFWTWFARQSARDQLDVAAPILRRLRPLLLYPALRGALGQVDSGFDMAQVVHEKKILVCSFARERLGDELSALAGALVATKLWNTIEARGTGTGQPFYWYCDEFHDVLNNLPVAFGQIIAQGRNYDVGLTLAHQHMGQIDKAMRDEISANVRNKIVFQTTLGADMLAAQLGDPVTEVDVTNLGAFEVLVRLTVQGRTTRAATATTYQPRPANGLAEQVIARARERYGRPYVDVDREIRARHDGALVGPEAVPQVDEPPIGWEPWES